MYPTSIKTRKVYNMGKTIPDGISRIERNLLGGGDGFPNTFWTLVEYENILNHQSFYNTRIMKSFPVDREGLTVLESILLC